MGGTGRGREPSRVPLPVGHVEGLGAAEAAAGAVDEAGGVLEGGGDPPGLRDVEHVQLGAFHGVGSQRNPGAGGWGRNGELRREIKYIKYFKLKI